MSQTPIAPTPGWQTEELQDEWVDIEPDDEEEDQDNVTYGTHSISLTAPLATQIYTNSTIAQEISQGTQQITHGTFLVREDVPDAQFLPKIPGQKKGLIKDIFTPLPLERMFEPPSPTQSNNQLSYANSSSSSAINRESSNHPSPKAAVPMVGRNNPTLACRFTFTVPRERAVSLQPTIPQAQSTPIPPTVFQPRPQTEHPLRLFQYHYDTYTREHLSALVDSIAVNTPSATGTTASPTSFTRLSRVSEVTGIASVASGSHLRSAKRIKLSPLTDYYGEGAGSQAVISRPKLTGKDYVGESKHLMQQIKSARDFSTISTTVTARDSSQASPEKNAVQNVKPPSLAKDSHLAIPKDNFNTRSTSSSPHGSRRSQYSSSSYRQQAETLMAQIKEDVKGQKRLFSGETDVSLSTNKEKKGVASSTVSSPEVSLNSLGSAFSSPRQSFRRSTNTNASSQSGRHNLTDGLSRMSLSTIANPIQVIIHTDPPLLSITPPSHPQASVRASATEELNRFVSSSTAGGTTITSGSAPSFVKHPGPAHIRTIAPQDVPSLPDRYGDMVFDKVHSRWVKNTAVPQESQPAEPSEDPFIDIESLRDETRNEDDSDESEEEGTARQGLYSVLDRVGRIEEQLEMDDEEADLMSFSTDASSHIVSVMTGVDPNDIDDDAQTTDSDDNVELVQPHSGPLEFDSEDEDFHTVDNINNTSASQVPFTPAPDSTAIRSALKSHNTTPNSVLKDPNRNRYQTPLQEKGYRRSVSFSDGKRDGPIQGLNDSTSSAGIQFLLDDVSTGSANGAMPSARSKRIEEMMQALEGSDIDEDDSSPSRGSSFRGEELEPLINRRPKGNQGSASTRIFSRSQTRRTTPSKQDISKANGTFLTECSFGVSHDRLVTVITDVQPFEPYWDELNSIDLSGKSLESVARMKEFLPRLDVLNLNSNELAWLSGVPDSLRTLSVASNRLSGLTSFSHLLNLENLDISHNDLDSLCQLECLRHLRELKADGNKIKSLDGLQKLDGLVKLSLQRNLIQNVDLTDFRWKRLEMLNLSHNRIENIMGAEKLHSLIALNLDDNSLKALEISGTLPRLRILRLSGNRLRQLDAGVFVNLRTLYADNNSLTHLLKLNRLTKLENVSLRNQSGRGLNLPTRDIRDVKRLYLSGNPLQPTFISEACYNLIYMEVAACRLTALPEDMGKLVPNLRVLNLNYNFLEDARPLEDLTRLEKLTIIGSRLKKTKPLIRLVQRMPDVEMLDFRMNPCTLGWYLPLLVKDVPGALQPSESRNGTSEGDQRGKDSEQINNSWQELDAKFRRDLPDELYIGRLAYRGLIMRACRRLRMLDGVVVTEKERTKAHKVLMGILNKNKDKESKGRGEERR